MNPTTARSACVGRLRQGVCRRAPPERQSGPAGAHQRNSLRRNGHDFGDEALEDSEATLGPLARQEFIVVDHIWPEEAARSAQASERDVRRCVLASAGPEGRRWRTGKDGVCEELGAGWNAVNGGEEGGELGVPLAREHEECVGESGGEVEEEPRSDLCGGERGAVGSNAPLTGPRCGRGAHLAEPLGNVEPDGHGGEVGDKEHDERHAKPRFPPAPHG